MVCDTLTHWLPAHSPTHWKETPLSEGPNADSNYIFLMLLLHMNRNPLLRIGETELCSVVGSCYIWSDTHSLAVDGTEGLLTSLGMWISMRASFCF